MQVIEDSKESQDLLVAVTSDSCVPRAGSASSLGSSANTDFLCKLNQIAAF